MELFPEQELSSGVNINLRVAYPAVRESSNNDLILTKEDFDGPGDKLLDKLGLNLKSEPATLTEKEIERIKKLFLTLVSRYIGLLSCVPLKNCSEALEYGLERIYQEIKSKLHAFRSISLDNDNEAVQLDEHEDQRNNPAIKELLLQRDELSKNIKEAIEKRSYRDGPFKENNKEIYSVIDWKKIKFSNKVR